MILPSQLAGQLKTGRPGNSALPAEVTLQQSRGRGKWEKESAGAISRNTLAVIVSCNADLYRPHADLSIFVLRLPDGSTTPPAEWELLVGGHFLHLHDEFCPALEVPLTCS